MKKPLLATFLSLMLILGCVPMAFAQNADATAAGEAAGAQASPPTPASPENTTAQATDIFLNGQNGNDQADGLSPAKAVKTFSAAKALAEKMPSIRTIYVTGKTAIAGEVTLAGTNAIVRRHESYSDVLFSVEKNTEATLSSITIDGNSENRVKTTQSLIHVGDGTLRIRDGAVLRNNVSTRIQNSGGAVSATRASVNMDGGLIEGNLANRGGGISLYRSRLDLSGGEIRGNMARSIPNTSTPLNDAGAGGGIYLTAGSTVNFTGGNISENSADEVGGGISIGNLEWSDGSDTLNMDGGVVRANTAGATGGGIFIQCSAAPYTSKAVISGGQIIDNRATGDGRTNNAFGGGGIYVNGFNHKLNWTGDYEFFKKIRNGQLHLTNVLITDNTAALEGGGLASCPVSDTHIYLRNGGAIYANKSGSDRIRDLYILCALNYSDYGTHIGNPEYSISPIMMGGVPYHWQDRNDVTVPLNALHGTLQKNGDTLQLNTPEVGNENTRRLTRVTITGNRSATRGGGIGSNGTVVIGTRETISLDFIKSWNDLGAADPLRPESITVELYQKRAGSDDEPQYVGFERLDKTDDLFGDDSWFGSFRNLPKFDEDGTEFEYSIREKEIPGYVAEYDRNGSGTYLIKNLASTRVPVKKVWKGNAAISVEVKLLVNGRENGQTLTLNAENNWTSAFENLPKYAHDGKPIEYAVKEGQIEAPAGAKYERSMSGNAKDGFVLVNQEVTPSVTPTPSPTASPSPTPTPSTAPSPTPGTTPTPTPGTTSSASPSPTPTATTNTSRPSVTPTSVHSVPTGTTTTTTTSPNRLPETGESSMPLAALPLFLLGAVTLTCYALRRER